MKRPTQSPWATLLGLWALFLMILGAASAPNPTSTPDSPNSGKELKQCGRNCDTCQAPFSPSPSSRPSLSSREEQTLSKRVVAEPLGPPWNGNFGLYVWDHIYGDHSNGTEWIQLASSRGFGQSIAKWRDMKDKPWSMVLGQLSGCPSVLAFSQKTLYITHHWEVGSLSLGDWKIGTQERFKSYVLDELKHGGGAPDMPSLSQVAQTGDLASKYHPSLFLFQRRDSGNHPAYDKEYNARMQQIGFNIYKITGVTPKLAKYTPLYEPEPDESIKGMLFIQYDPRGVQDDCGDSRAMLRVYLENKLVYLADWERLPGQGPPDGQQPANGQQ